MTTIFDKKASRKHAFNRSSALGKNAERRTLGRSRSLLEFLESRQLLSADLSGAFTLTPATALNGSIQTATITVTNTGNTAAKGPVVVDIKVVADGADPATAATLKRITRVGGIAAGSTRNITFQVPLSAALTGGNYRLVAVVDPGNKVAESNESNNTFESNDVAVTQRDIDLVAGFAARQASVSSVVSGRNTNGQVFITITNNGTATTAAGQTVDVQVFARPMGNTNASSDVLLNRGVINGAAGNLAAGASRTIAVPVQFQNTLPNGNFSLVTQLNGTDTVAESNMSDDVALSSGTIAVASSNVLAGSTLPAQTNQILTSNVPVDSLGNPIVTTNPSSINNILPTTSLNNILPTTSFSNILPTTSLSNIIPTTSLTTDLPTTLSTVPVNLVGVTPLTSIGNTPLSSIGNTPLNSLGLTPTETIGDTSTISIGLVQIPTNSIGLSPTNSTGLPTLTGDLGLVTI